MSDTHPADDRADRAVVRILLDTIDRLTDALAAKEAELAAERARNRVYADRFDPKPVVVVGEATGEINEDGWPLYRPAVGQMRAADWDPQPDEVKVIEVYGGFRSPGIGQAADALQLLSEVGRG